MYFERFKPFDFELITDNILDELEEDKINDLVSSIQGK